MLSISFQLLWCPQCVFLFILRCYSTHVSLYCRFHYRKDLKIFIAQDNAWVDCAVDVNLLHLMLTWHFLLCKTHKDLHAKWVETFHRWRLFSVQSDCEMFKIPLGFVSVEQFCFHFFVPPTDSVFERRISQFGETTKKGKKKNIKNFSIRKRRKNKFLSFR